MQLFQMATTQPSFSSPWIENSWQVLFRIWVRITQVLTIADEVATIGSREDSLPALKKAIEYAQTTPSRTILMASSNRVVGTASELESITELMNQSGVIIHTMDGSYEMVAQYGSSPEMLIAQTLADTDEDIDEDIDEDEGMGGMSL